MLFTPAQRRILQWAALGLAVGVVVWLLGPVLTPFAIGAVLAYALHPLVEKLAATGCRGCSRWRSSRSAR